MRSDQNGETIVSAKANLCTQQKPIQFIVEIALKMRFIHLYLLSLLITQPFLKGHFSCPFIFGKLESVRRTMKVEQRSFLMNVNLLSRWMREGQQNQNLKLKVIFFEEEKRKRMEREKKELIFHLSTAVTN